MNEKLFAKRLEEQGIAFGPDMALSLASRILAAFRCSLIDVDEKRIIGRAEGVIECYDGSET